MSASREMTLQEWVERLPEIHRARREYEGLCEAACTSTTATEKLLDAALEEASQAKQDVRNLEAQVNELRARCTAARLTPAEVEVLRGLVKAVERADHDADEEIAAAARNALPLIARLVGEGT